MEIHPDTAKEHGIRDGDWVWIENNIGRCRQKAKVTPTIHPNVVNAGHGWWYPEKPGPEPSLFGVWESVHEWAANYNQGRQRLFDRLLVSLYDLTSGTDHFENWASFTIGARLPLDLSPHEWYAKLKELAISRSTYYSWLKRYEDEGDEGLMDSRSVVKPEDEEETTAAKVEEETAPARRACIDSPPRLAKEERPEI